MKRIFSLFLLCTLPALSQAAVSDNSQQNKMTVCNKAATGKTGDARKAFMKTCLSAKVEAVANPQQNRMKVCNEQAAGQKGEQRKAFMSTCLKG